MKKSYKERHIDKKREREGERKKKKRGKPNYLKSFGREFTFGHFSFFRQGISKNVDKPRFLVW